jgi:hypothetical protein
VKTLPSDDELRRRLQELGRREATTAPSLERVLQGRRPVSDGTPVGLFNAGWRPQVITLAGVFVIAAVAWWWPVGPHGGRPVVPDPERSQSDPVEEWALPTDGLAAEAWDGAGRREVERLSREIEGLLRR